MVRDLKATPHFLHDLLQKEEHPQRRLRGSHRLRGPARPANPAVARALLTRLAQETIYDPHLEEAEAAAADHAQVAAEAAGPYGGLGILDRWAHAFPAREPPPFDEEPEVDCVRAWSDPLDALWHADV